MANGLRMDGGAVVEAAAAHRAVGADLAAIDLRGVGLAPGELAGSLTAVALSRAVDVVAGELQRVAKRIEDLGRRTAWGATALDGADAAAADGVRRGGG